MLFIFFITIIFSPTFIYNNYEYTLDEIEIDSNIVPIVEKIEGTDWNGDGYIYQEYIVNNDNYYDIIDQISNNSKWQKGNLEKKLYYMFLNKTNDNFIGIDCYYYFKNRHPEATGNIYSYKDIKKEEQYSWNYTIGVFDFNNKKLYYFQYDT